MSEESKPHGAAYVTWTTFKRAVDGFADGVLPNRIDRSLFPTQSGAVQYQLIAALKFLGLIGEDEAPTHELKKLVSSDEGTRKELLTSVFEKRYADLFSLDLTKATPAQLNEQMAKSYGVNGSTRTKAVRFFLSAVKYLEIPVAPHLDQAVKATPASFGGAKKRKRKKRMVDAQPTRADNGTPSPTGPARTVALESGGSVSLAVTMDPFTVSERDRAFVFGLIGALRDYAEAEEEESDEEIEATE